MSGTPANFIIIGYTDPDGKVMMTALSDVCRVTIDQDIDRNDIQAFGGNIVKSIVQHTRNITVEAEARPDGMTHVLADDHATAWRRLFDTWVPPASAAGVADEDSQNAVAAHYAFNPPKPVPAKPKGMAQGYVSGGGGGGGGGMVAGSFIPGGSVGMGAAGISGHTMVYGANGSAPIMPPVTPQRDANVYEADD